MKIEVVPNRGPASMGPEVERSLEWSEQTNIASAFVTPKALKWLEQALTQAKQTRKRFTMHLLFGLYQRFTPPDALKRLLELQKQFPGMLHARVARNSRFHWKLYIFQKGSTRRFYIGSANLTEDALVSSGELSIRITAKSSEPVAMSLENEFNMLWQEEHSFMLTKDVWEMYRKEKRPTILPIKKDSAITKLLNRPEKITSMVNVETRLRPRPVFINDYLQSETEQIIEENTEWNQKNWNYMVNTKYWHDAYVKAKTLLVVERFDNPVTYRVSFQGVEETAELETPDGKYFIAYSKIPDSRSRQYSLIKKQLDVAGLTRKTIDSSRQLSRRQLEIVCRLLSVNPKEAF